MDIPYIHIPVHLKISLCILVVLDYTAYTGIGLYAGGTIRVVVLIT